MTLSTLRPRPRLLTRAAALAALCLGLALPSAAHAQRGFPFSGSTNGVQLKDSPKFKALFRDVVAGAAKSTVRVQCDGKDAGLGVVVSADGYILTHATDMEGKITVKLREGEPLEARLVGVHPAHNLALLKVNANGLNPIRWTDSKVAAAGNWVASVGTGTDPLTVGVVGVATRTVPGAKGARVLPVSGYLGIEMSDEGPGVIVGKVQPKTAAAKAGLKVNDVILAVSGKQGKQIQIADAEALTRTISGRKPGDTVVLKIRRGEEEMELKATLGKRPPGLGSRGDFQNSLGSKLSKIRSGYPTVLQHDGVVLPDDCGGPLVDLDGHVIGLNIARAGRTESYAIPSEVIRSVLPELMSGKLAPQKASK
jgi:serine protease Do